VVSTSRRPTARFGKEFIHVHHLKEIATIAQKYQVDPVNDLRPVCPNCHAMLHQHKSAFFIVVLKLAIGSSSAVS
tara:strand:- start:1922 stop:2146 length:225 start_codon:yes stop_codon:yes gene_type:complete